MGKRYDQLSFGAGFQSMAIAGASLCYLFNNMTLLVNLNRKDAAIVTLIAR